MVVNESSLKARQQLPDPARSLASSGNPLKQLTKQAQKILGRLLKRNPVDAVNRFTRWFLDKFHLLAKTDRMFYWSAWVVVRQFMRAYWNWRVEGAMFPDFGRGIVVANHQSHLDPFFIGCAAQRRIQWMSKEENFHTPIMTSIFRNLGAFPLRRGDEESTQRALDKVRSIINEEREWVGIFPEGTRSTDGSLGEFKSGAVRLAIELDVPIVPAAVVGSDAVLPKGSLFMKPKQVITRLGEPVWYSDYHGTDVPYGTIKRLTAELRDKVVELVETTQYQHGGRNTKALSIGTSELKPKSRKRFFQSPKGLLKNALRVWDDAWYALLKALEPWDLREQFQEHIYHFSGNVVAEYCRVFNPARMVGFEHIPEKGGAIVTPNHNSEWDVIMIATAIQQQRKRVLYQMSKEVLFKMPVVNAWTRTHHAFPLRRGASDFMSFEHAVERAKEGHLVCIYPEGTTNAGNGHLLEGHTGAVRAAIEAQVPIIPVGITGTEKIFPKHAKMVNLGKGCALKVGEPFTAHARYFGAPEPDYAVLKNLTRDLMAEIKGLLLYNAPEA